MDWNLAQDKWWPLALIVLFPALGALVNGLAGLSLRRQGRTSGETLVSAVALIASWASFAVSVWAVWTLVGLPEDASGYRALSYEPYVWIPSIRTVVVGDIAFRGVHPWTAESNADARKAWIKTLDEIAALKPDTVVAGHKDPKHKDDVAGLKQTRDYLEAFDQAVASSKTAAEVQDKMKKKFGDLQLDVILQFGAAAQFPPAAPAPAAPAATPATTPAPKK